jgi:hypothetical protein
VTDESKAALADSLLKVGTQLGVPVLILAAVLFMAREAGVAIYGTAVVPLVKAHSDFLESTQATLQQIGETQKQQADTLREIVAGQRELASMIEGHKGQN